MLGGKLAGEQRQARSPTIDPGSVALTRCSPPCVRSTANSAAESIEADPTPLWLISKVRGRRAFRLPLLLCLVHSASRSNDG